MSAIIELLIAMIIEPLMLVLKFAGACIQFLIQLLWVIVCSVWVRVRRGHSEAAAYYREHKPKRAQRDSTATDSPSIRSPAGGGNRANLKSLWAFGTMVFLVILWGSIQWLNERIQSNRVDSTRQQLQQLADNIGVAVRDQQGNGPVWETGQPIGHDAWQQSLDLIVDRWAIGTLVVVRSAGRDGQTGTLDDLISARGIGPAGLPMFVHDEIKKRVGGILGKVNLKQIPIDWKMIEPHARN